MSNTNREPTPDILDQAAGALRAAPVPAGPPADLTAATVAAVQNRLADLASAELARRNRRRRIMRYVGYGSAAAVVAGVATLAGVLWVGGGPAAAHFEKALDNAEKATSVKATLTIENKGKVTHVHTVHRKGDRVRVEVVQDRELPDKPIRIIDLKTRASLILLPQEKVARKQVVGAQEIRFATGMFGNFTGIKAELARGDAKAVKDLGEEKLGGRTTRAYEMTSKGPAAGIWKVWVDAKTDLPVRARLAEEKTKNAFTIDFSDWNKDLDAKLFSLDVPEGYKLIESPGP